MLRSIINDSDKKLKISLVSVPFSGHLKIVAKLAKELIAQNRSHDITLIVTGWDNVKMSSIDAEELRQVGVKIVELCDGDIEGAQPMAFTFPRVSKLSDQVIDMCKSSDYIVYDFFAIEGYIAGKQLNIPAVCSVPAIMGPFDPACEMFKRGIVENAKYISVLESKYQIDIIKNLEMVSDGFLLPSDYQNIQWSWPNFIKASNYTENRCIKNYQFIRPEKVATSAESSLAVALKQAKIKKKIIYVSLGTVVTGNLWNNVPGTRRFVRDIFNNIKEQFGGKDEYEVVVSTGRKVEDLFETIPANFHVFESVAQQEILALSDVFVTHGGGNSVNEAVDAEIPMVVIPFFGDQHLCADNVAKLGIGVAFAADESVKVSVVDTEACHLARASMADANAVGEAINAILTCEDYKDRIKSVKSNKPVLMSSLPKLLVNDRSLNWHEGDLLYGCNDDRKKLAALTGRNDFYRLCDYRAFSTLFADRKNDVSMPRIIDQYHDVLTNMTLAAAESRSTRFHDYRDTLSEYGHFIQTYLDQLKRLQGDANSEKRDALIWQMCLAGLSFFIYNKQKTIHFVVGKYNDQINMATKRELAWVKAHWQDKVVRDHVKFYQVNNGELIQTDPEKVNWFEIRSTPSLDDAAPDKVDQQTWRNAMLQIKAHKKHLFFNHYPERYANELEVLKASGASIIDLQNTPNEAKRSLATGEVHIFAIQTNGKATLARKVLGTHVISHAAAATSEPVVCAGEVRLRSICVKGKWFKVIDLSNESGHYQPNSSGLLTAIEIFKGLGYTLHRVNVVNIRVKESFHQVDEALSEFKPLRRAMTI